MHGQGIFKIGRRRNPLIAQPYQTHIDGAANKQGCDDAGEVEEEFHWAMINKLITNVNDVSKSRTLLHRHTLRQVPWLVYITATHNGNVVAEQLQRNGVDERTQAFFGFGNLYHVIRQIIQAGVAF